MKKMKKLLKDMDKPLLILTIFMIGYGLLNIVTASSREAVSQDVPLYYYFYKQSEMLGIALVLSIILLNFNTKKYDTFAFLAYFVLLFILGFLYFNGEAHRGSKNWIELGGITFQPSEFAKPVLIVILAILFEKFYKKLRTKGANHDSLILLLVFAGVLYPVLVFLQKDLGTGAILLGIFGILFLFSPILRVDKIRFTFILGGMVLFACIVFLASGNKILTTEQMDRFNFFNPCSNYEKGGYQVCNGMIAINDGGLLGLGIGKSKQKYSYIPEPHTDSVFAIIMEEYGLIFCAILLAIYTIILYRIFLISSSATTIRGRYICMGVGGYIFFHIFINLGGLFGILPLTGVPLPFLSYGGSFTISLICSLAMVQRVSIETKNTKIKIKEAL